MMPLLLVDMPHMGVAAERFHIYRIEYWFYVHTKKGAAAGALLGARGETHRLFRGGLGQERRMHRADGIVDGLLFAIGDLLGIGR